MCVYHKSGIFRHRQLLRRGKKRAKIKYTYIAEPLGGEIFLTQKFKMRIIFNAKIFRSMILSLFTAVV